MLVRYFLLGAVLSLASADLEIDCRYKDALGTWEFTESARDKTGSESCAKLGLIFHRFNVTLRYPNIAMDQIGNTGTWTMVYNQGIEVRINERNYWAPFYWEPGMYACNKLSVGWAHDLTVRHWSCFSAKRIGGKGQGKLRRAPKLLKTMLSSEAKYKDNLALVDQINRAQTSWRAVAYRQHENYTVGEMMKRNGGLKYQLPPRARSTPEEREAAAKLPRNFDWRNVSGLNYVSPPRDQGNCGSCYAFASTGMIEARMRIATNFSRQDIFSPMDIVRCSKISEGCDGGFAYLIAGRYAREQGLANEECSPYRYMRGDRCDSCPRTYVDDYHYVGGFYGATNEHNMMIELVRKGPLTVAFTAGNDFMMYDHGIYHHTIPSLKGLKGTFEPFVATNHAVLLVGYGVDEPTGEKFWIVKNSWGKYWGEKGFFRIRRGTNEVGIESCAVAATPIP